MPYHKACSHSSALTLFYFHSTLFLLTQWGPIYLIIYYNVNKQRHELLCNSLQEVVEALMGKKFPEWSLLNREDMKPEEFMQIVFTFIPKPKDQICNK